MKNLFFALFAICILFLNSDITTAQPHLNLALKPSEHTLNTSKNILELKGKVETERQFGYDFFSLFHRTGITTVLRKGVGLTLFVDSSFNISISDSSKRLNTELFSYLLKVYSPERAKEIMRDHYNVYETSIISDTISAASGLIYLGDQSNPGVAKCSITRGTIIMTYKAETNEMSIVINNVFIKEESDDWKDEWKYDLIKFFKL